MAINLSGLLLPVTTQFSASEDIDADGLIKNLSKWNQTGITGYVVLGSTGERVNLDEREYLQVIEIARRVVPGSFTFIERFFIRPSASISSLALNGVVT